MIYLLLSILSSTAIYVVFKLLDRFKINSLYAIVVNYFTACIAGYFGLERAFTIEDTLAQDWIFGAILLGVLFITVFNLMAITTQKSGLSAVSVASKMSVAIPILFVIFYYNEPTGFLKICGIALALVAVYLSSVKTKSGIQLEKNTLIYPLLVFLGSGIIETLIKFLEQNFVTKEDVALFSTSIFICAAVIGMIIGIIHFTKKKIKFTYREVLGGIALGIPNYYSIYFFIQALRSGMPSTTVFILNNVAIVLLSTLLGILLFKEKLLRKNWIGIALAVVSIILVALTTR
ncbi:GRP family sugar transporter [Mesonia aestuariivivens]|uniref:GRP family sugar transporter n=1 Tax=Mesonia aestuariivivens TaxID=2796128 RepID=A0ABS6W033_9FLAO|nr:GRP family sugar transporter [Mesonia aestuariivivens]MBW2961205.1 GRP family sugar transporter [Mesonia aestuariivivens]